jgi:formylglycine-generating enzyme required for sulfatase activity
MLHGISWIGTLEFARSAHRFRGVPEVRLNYIGFRVAKTL